MKKYEIIDFHTHPFLKENSNICSHKEYCNMSSEETVKIMKQLGVSQICGSVIGNRDVLDKGGSMWDVLLECNNEALKLRDLYGDFYIPGFHIHPDFVRESCEEIERMNEAGVKLIGELVPYHHGWNDYSLKAFDEILDVAKQYNMIVSFHSMGENEMDEMVRKHTDVIFVAAHPGEYGEFMRHMKRMAMSNNYYMDLSGYGLFRYGMLRRAIDEFGAKRFIYGSDYPTCNPGMYIGGILFDDLITDSEKKQIFAENAKRILKIK